MTDIVASISSAISLASRLKAISANIKDAEFANLLADLSLEQANAKAALAGLIDENTQLKQQIRGLEKTERDPCPKCLKEGWHVEGSRPDRTFGALGGIRRTYRCSLCGFTEERLVTPK